MRLEPGGEQSGDLESAARGTGPDGGRRRTRERGLIAAARAQESATSLSIRSAPAPGQGAPLPDLPPDAFGGYEVLRVLHRGGQGAVYEALQKGTRRHVAIKVLREGPFAGPSDRARFEREIQILGRLQHPHIVTIHHAGLAHGCFYFVMDLVRGETLDAHVAGRTLPVAEVLRLFAKICDAVHAAHVKGIIHRDLKPSNIRVDETGEPRVLDFGLAKVAESNDEVGREVTVSGQFLGSLYWASPEQARGEADRIDVRTDVYSLGVILHQILTGEFPYEVLGSIPEVLRNILDSSPRRPSSIRHGLDDDIDTIVLKCLAKAPERRYQSAATLAEDVRRHLNHEPILARAPSTVYQVRMLVRRHRLPAALMGALFVVVLAFAIAMTGMYRQAVTQRNRAIEAEKQAEQRRADAERGTQTANAIRDFLVDDLLAAASPEVARGREVTVREALSRAAEQVETAFETRPELEAPLRQTIAEVYLSLGSTDSAVAHARAADSLRTRHLGAEHAETLRGRTLLVSALISAGSTAEADELSAHLLDVARDTFGVDDPRTLEASFERARVLYEISRIGDSMQLHHDTLGRRRRVLGDTHPATLQSLRAWGELVHRREEDRQVLERIYRETLDRLRDVFGPDHPSTLDVQRGLGTLLMNQRRFAESEPLLCEVHETAHRVMGPTHSLTVETVSEIASLYLEQDRADEAERMLTELRDRLRSEFGSAHPLLFGPTEHLCRTLVRHDKPASAARMCREAYDLSLRYNGPSHYSTGHALEMLASTDFLLGRYAQAEAAIHRTVEIFTDANVRAGPSWCLRTLLAVLAAQGRADEARPYAIDLLERRRRAVELAPDDAYVLNCYARELLDVVPQDLADPKLALNVALQGFERSTDDYHYNRFTLARAYRANGDIANALAMVRRAVAHIPFEDSTERQQYGQLYEELLEASGEVGLAEAFHRQLLGRRIAEFGEEHPDVARSMEDLGAFLIRHRRCAEAEPLLQRSLAVRQARPDGEDWRIPRSRTLLAEAMNCLGRSAEAAGTIAQACDELAALNDAPASVRTAAIEWLTRVRGGRPGAD